MKNNKNIFEPLVNQVLLEMNEANNIDAMDSIEMQFLQEKLNNQIDKIADNLYHIHLWLKPKNPDDFFNYDYEIKTMDGRTLDGNKIYHLYGRNPLAFKIVFTRSEPKVILGKSYSYVNGYHIQFNDGVFYNFEDMFQDSVFIDYLKQLIATSYTY